MKFFLVIPFLAAGALAAATPVRRSPDIVRRDLATITNAVNNIASKVQVVDTDAKAFSGDGTALENASNAVITAINTGNTQIAATAPIGIADALTLQNVIQNLINQINTTVTDVIAKKAALVSAGLGATTHQSFVDQQNAARTLSITIESKVPAAVAPIASQDAATINSDLQNGINAFA